MIIIDLSRNVIKRYVAVTTPEKVTSTSDTVFGTVVNEGDTLYVQIDGSSILTPVSSTIDIREGDRVLVLLQNHAATVIGSPTSPTARLEELENLGGEVTRVGVLLADKVGTGELVAIRATIGELEVEVAKIEDLEAEVAKIGNLEAEVAKIGDLEAETAKIGNLEVEVAKIGDLEAEVAKIKDLDVENLEAEVAKIGDLEVEVAKIEDLEAEVAKIGNLEAQYADIEFANIGEAAIEKLFADSGIIKDLVMKDGYVTGELTAVTLNADLIKAGTLTADRLLLKGVDGLYYQLNSSLEGITAEQLSEQEYQEALHGDNIIAHTITAEKINVSDLVAFDATIGGWVIDSNALRTAGKGAFDAGTNGTYLGSNGSFGVGNNTNFITFDPTTGKIKIQADEISIGVNPVLLSETEEYYNSTSSTGLAGGSWSTTAPSWTNGRYIWRRTVCNYADGSVTYNPSQNGVCITGNTGATGPQGGTGAAGKMLFGTCGTGASTAAKTTSITGFSLYSGVVVAVKFSNANTAANPTLNVSNTGAKAIYLNGRPYSYWLAGATVNFVYDGTYWQVCSVPVYADNATIGNPATYNVYIDGDSMDIRSGSTELATFKANEIDLGKNSSTSIIKLCGGTGTIQNSNTTIGDITRNRMNITTNALGLIADHVGIQGKSLDIYQKSSVNNAEGTRNDYTSAINMSDAYLDFVAVNRWYSEPNVSSAGQTKNANLHVDPNKINAVSDQLDLCGRYGVNLSTTYGPVNLTANTDAMNISSGNHIYMTAPSAGLSAREFGVNKVLWSGAWHMHSGQYAGLSEALSAQPNGIVLVWSYYNATNGVEENSNWSYHFVPKYHTSITTVAGIQCLMATSSWATTASKYVYVSDTTVRGNDANTSSGTSSSGIKYYNNWYVLRYVLGV